MEERFPATDSTMNSTLMYANVIILLTAMVLGIPGNILSAIVWLRGHVVSKNSSAVYLAAIAIIDLISQILPLIYFPLPHGWFRATLMIIFQTAANLEALLILGFSIERLLAILRPLQVCCLEFCIRLTSYMLHTILNTINYRAAMYVLSSHEQSACPSIKCIV